MMVSAQVFRFQQRITNLQTHHELAVRRHASANRNYTLLSRDVMNSLMTHLAENDKKLKKTKRITKPRILLSQTSKHSRLNAVSDTVSPYTSYTDASRCFFRDEQYDVHNTLIPVGVDRTTANFGDYSYSQIDQDSSTPSRNHEPIFPPPTYADPTSPPSVVGYQFLPQPNNSSNQFQNLKAYEDEALSWSGDSSYVVNSASGCFNGESCSTQQTSYALKTQPISFVSHSDHYASPARISSRAPWSGGSGIPDDLTSTNLSTTVEKPAASCIRGQKHDFYSYTPISGDILFDHAHHRVSYSSCNLSCSSHCSCPAYSGINPILASTYPVVPSYHSNGSYPRPGFLSNVAMDPRPSNSLPLLERHSELHRPPSEFNYT
ncbi:uncharacterized protein DEA37_0011901 [Paragonimus westermani]|uniref:Uncharacterized protein n=1 Tax=Paragonimus westermani TaxID=34504 RepID=A0A5J4P0D9_9TREM|nr:uncharacterized protein DEA37_0011901 [Paragonimus westermani]